LATTARTAGEGVLRGVPVEPMILAGCPENGVILDPFMGAGTTGMVAKMNYRNFIGIELNPKYIDIARKRIDATLVNKKLNFKLMGKDG